MGRPAPPQHQRDMKSAGFEKYSEKVLSFVMGSLKKGVSGSIIADGMVSEFGFDREAALTIVAGTVAVLNKAGLI